MSNEIRVQDNIFFVIDESSVVIKETLCKFDKDGKELYNILGNYQTLQGAVRKMLRLNIAGNKTNDLSELLEGLNAIENKIDSVLEKVKEGNK